jgi:cysteinyl-tRNA synthetase
VKYWLHCAHLLVDAQKMSKSAGNFYTLRDLLARGYTGREIRYALLSVHYRLPLNFTLAGLDAARSALERIDAWTHRLHALASDAAPGVSAVSTERERFLAALDEDLNISEALAVLFDWIRETNRQMDQGALSAEAAARVLQDFLSLNTILAIDPDSVAIPPEVDDMVRERNAARAARDWKKSDELRDAIAALGWSVKDTKTGTQLTRNP